MSVHDIAVNTLSGEPASVGDHAGKTLLIVNVASRCGYTPQYAGLERLYRAHKEDEFVILGFPCDQFGRQEPGTDAEIQQFCSKTYDVTFPLFSKIKVNGPDASPLFIHLKSAKKGLLGLEAIKWNFTKFLVSPDGDVLKRYGSADTPESIERDLRARLSASPR